MSELERLLHAAREAMPDPLSNPAADAMIESAMRGATSLDRVLRDARRAEPDPLSEREVRAMAEHAAMTGRARHRRWTRHRVMTASVLAATLAAAAITLWIAQGREDDRALVARSAPAAARRTDLELPTGDRLVAASGARFDVELPEPRIRRVRLGGGAMLFDVRPIDEGRFTVATPSAEVTVLGTVFSVRATAQATTVWVYEGRVSVRTAEGVRIVRAGGVAHVGDGGAGDDPLASAGQAAAARRAQPTLATAEPAPRVIAASEAPRPSETPAPPRVRSPARPSVHDDATVDGADPSSPAAVRAQIAHGEAAGALAVIEDAIARGEFDPWRMLEGDALRVLGRFEDAAAAYERAARELDPPRRQQAGFLEARVRATQLGDAQGGLRALESAEVAAPGSVLRERGLALEAQLLDRLERSADAERIAREYLRDYPEGPDADSMRARISAEDP